MCEIINYGRFVQIRNEGVYVVVRFQCPQRPHQVETAHRCLCGLHKHHSLSVYASNALFIMILSLAVPVQHRLEFAGLMFLCIMVGWWHICQTVHIRIVSKISYQPKQKKSTRLLRSGKQHSRVLQLFCLAGTTGLLFCVVILCCGFVKD